jgi:hypothetical protein
MITLKNGEPNALDFFVIRELHTYPKHFDSVTVEMKYNMEDSVKKWITNHLKGRFYIGKTVVLNRSNNFQTVLKVGFESPKELSYFMLACPHLKYA